MIKPGYKRLGDYIEPMDERNSNLSVKLSQGICNNKYFITPRQVAENSANDKIVRTGQFAYNRATTRNGDKISIAYREGPDCTVSSAYQIFRIKDENKLNPHYLWMWFRRPEFDRYARFKSRGSAHEFFEWDEMCEVYLPIPVIKEQRRIVAEYQAVEKRIISNEALIKHLKESAKFIFKKRIIDEISLDNLPIGWSLSTISGFCKKMTSGGTPNRGIDEYWNGGSIPWIKTGEVQDNIIFQAEEFITDEALKNSSAKMIPAGTVVMAMYGGGTIANIGFLQLDTTTNQACCNMICNNYSEAAYLFFHLLYHQEEIRRLANGGAQENLSQEVIGSTSIVKPGPDFDYSCFTSILDAIISYSKEIIIDRKIHELLLTRLSK